MPSDPTWPRQPRRLVRAGLEAPAAANALLILDGYVQSSVELAVR